MFPVVFALLIIGSVILMIVWEFKPFIKTQLIPSIIKLLSVSDEMKFKPPIYLAQSPLKFEYSFLANLTEKELWLAFPHIMKRPITTLLKNLVRDFRLRIILGRKADAEQIKESTVRLDKEVEIVHRHRIHFKLLLNEKSLAVGSANFSSQGLEKLHELTIVSKDNQILKEARIYLSAFCDEFSEYPLKNQIISLSSLLSRASQSSFVNTSNGLNDLVYALLSSAEQSVVLVSPYITNAVAEYILKAIADDVQVRFVTWVDWRQWVNERSDPEALEMFLSNRVKVETCPNLHANCVIIDGKAAIVSSQNLTNECWNSRDEAGIFTKNPELIQTILERIESWQPKTQLTLQLLEQEIEKLDTYFAKETIRTPPLPDQEEDEAVPIDVGELITPPLLGFTSLPEQKFEPPPVPDPTEVLVPAEVLGPIDADVDIPTEIPVEPYWLEDVVFVGKKRLMDYVWASLFQVKKHGSVTIKARGRLIYRAVELAELVRNKFMPDLTLTEDSIQIDTYYPKDRKRKWGGISEIVITLQKKN